MGDVIDRLFVEDLPVHSLSEGDVADVMAWLAEPVNCVSHPMRRLITLLVDTLRKPHQAPRSRHQRALDRRIKHLTRRVDNAPEGQGSLSYDLQELDALRVASAALEALRLEQTGQVASTGFLMEEAVYHLIGDHRAQTMERTALVLELRARARLLAQVGGHG